MREHNTQTSFLPIAVQPLGFISSLGNSPVDIYLSIETQLATLDELENESIDHDTHIASKIYGAMAIEMNARYAQRFNTLLERSFAQAVTAFKPHWSTLLSAANSISQLLVIIQLPATHTARAESICYTEIEKKIHNAETPWNQIAITFIESSNALFYASQLLQQRPELMAVIVGAVDSLFNPDTITTLADNNELKTAAHENGVALGEAAGWLAISRTVKQSPLVIQQYATASDPYALVTATRALQLKEHPQLFIKMYSDTTHHLNQQHEINLRCFEKKLDRIPGKNSVQLVDLPAHCGLLGGASAVIALAYLAGCHEANLILWESALIVSCDMESNQAHSFLITQRTAT